MTSGEMGWRGIHHISLVVADTSRALTFYQDLLGWKIDRSRPELGFPGAWLSLGTGQQLHLLEVPNPDPVDGRPEHGGRDRHLALSIENLEALEKKLQQAGIGYRRSASGRSALFCRDFDGNTLEFIQVKQSE
ncbi:MAG: VOC family protein [bacterium]